MAKKQVELARFTVLLGRVVDGKTRTMRVRFDALSLADARSHLARDYYSRGWSALGRISREKERGVAAG